MYYLKCNHCGHFNEVKTEYFVFCENCNTKLENNFSNWVKKNPGKSFEEYKQEVCTTEKTEIATSSPKSQKRKSLKYWIGFAVAFAIFYALGQIGGAKLAGVFGSSGSDKELVDMANEFNKSCPIMIDEATRLDNTVALPNKVFQYNYTLVGVDKSSADIPEMKNYLKPLITDNVKSNPDMQKFRDDKVTLKYSYKDRTGHYLFSISVNPADYE